MYSVEEAVVCGRVIHYLVDHGAQLNGQDANGWTPLHYAAIRGNEVATYQLLKEPGIDIEVITSSTKNVANIRNKNLIKWTRYCFSQCNFSLGMNFTIDSNSLHGSK